jgi:hypothetical protein
MSRPRVTSPTMRYAVASIRNAMVRRVLVVEPLRRDGVLPQRDALGVVAGCKYRVGRGHQSPRRLEGTGRHGAGGPAATALSRSPRSACMVYQSSNRVSTRRGPPAARLRRAARWRTGAGGRGTSTGPARESLRGECPPAVPARRRRRAAASRRARPPHRRCRPGPDATRPGGRPAGPPWTAHGTTWRRWTARRRRQGGWARRAGGREHQGEARPGGGARRPAGPRGRRPSTSAAPRRAAR